MFHQVLARYWGYTEFRPLQEEIIRSVYSGKDTLGLMPTGGGKSVTFQVPALCMEGVCLVVTPLIALMKDQVDNLAKLGIRATAVYSGMTQQEIAGKLENCVFGHYKFLYVSPERLENPFFLSKLQAMKVCMLVVDESHCISQWGYDFRPSYLTIAAIRAYLPDIPVLALTATATPEVERDIMEKLRFSEPNVFRQSFFRNNLAYIVRQTEDKPKMLLRILQKVPGTAIVYARNRKHTKEVALTLQQEGIAADYFHAGLTRQEKERRQNGWKNNTCRVIVATNAFGMGIDKPDVRLVIHLDLPESLEEYFQEAGRAGRDGEKAYAVVLYDSDDCGKLQKQLTCEFPEKSFIYNVYEALGKAYHIPPGFGKDTVHDFHLYDFCVENFFPLLPTHHALKLLALSGYIEYTEEIENLSQVIITCNKDDLYKYHPSDPLTDKILQTLLHACKELFSDYERIEEASIASFAECSASEVREALEYLSKVHILDYIPGKKSPLILFTRAREEAKRLVIPRFAYENRKEKCTYRINKVLEYVTDTRRCRNKILLSYFGEKDAKDCGKCDVCLARHQTDLKNYEFNAIRESLLRSLSDGEKKEVRLLLSVLTFDENNCLKVIRFLAENDKRFTLEDGCYLKLNTSSRPDSHLNKPGDDYGVPE